MGVGVGVGGRDEGGGLQWRDPNLPEVIGFLNSPSDVVKANAAAYLQHLTYMDDPNKQKTRSLGNFFVIIGRQTYTAFILIESNSILMP